MSTAAMTQGGIQSVDWGSKVTSLSYDETEIIKWIIDLHNAGRAFDLDATYSTGHIWRNLPEPRYKFDLVPQAAGCVRADSRSLPLSAASLSSIMFDPPFVVAPNPKPGIVRDRFSCYPNIAALWRFYRESLREFYRVLRPEGVVAFKCQDVVDSGTNYMTHAAVVVMAQEAGFYVKDLFVLARANVLWSPNMEKQQHARKTHRYYIVLVKALKGRRRALSLLRQES